MFLIWIFLKIKLAKTIANREESHYQLLAKNIWAGGAYDQSQTGFSSKRRNGTFCFLFWDKSQSQHTSENNYTPNFYLFFLVLE